MKDMSSNMIDVSSETLIFVEFPAKRRRPLHHERAGHAARGRAGPAPLHEVAEQGSERRLLAGPGSGQRPGRELQQRAVARRPQPHEQLQHDQQREHALDRDQLADQQELHDVLARGHRWSLRGEQAVQRAGYAAVRYVYVHQHQPGYHPGCDAVQSDGAAAD